MKVIKGNTLEYIPASHEDKTDPEVWKKVLLDKEYDLSGKIMMVNWAKLPAGRAFKTHYHEDMTEVFILIAGKAAVSNGSKTVELATGDALIVEPKDVHTMKNLTDKDVLYIVFGVAHGTHGKTINT